MGNRVWKQSFLRATGKNKDEKNRTNPSYNQLKGLGKFTNRIKSGRRTVGASSLPPPIPPSSSSGGSSSFPPAAASSPPSTSSSSASSSSSSSPQGGGRRRRGEERKNRFSLLAVLSYSFQNQPATEENAYTGEQGGWGRESQTERTEGPPTPPAPFLLIANGCRKGSREEEEDEAKSQESPLHILLCRNKEAEERLLSRWRQQRSRDGSWRGWASGRAPATPPFLPFFLSGRVPLSGETTGSIPKRGGGGGGGSGRSGPSPLLSASPPSPKDTDGYERLIYGKDKALLGTGDAVPQAFQERPRLLSTI